MSVRSPAVAGLFYSDDSDSLADEVRGLLQEVEADGPPPKAMILPHAGYAYSGAVAARGYVRLRRVREVVTRVVLIGPAHYVPLRGLAVSGAETFTTPLGPVPVDRPSVERLLGLPQVTRSESAHLREHSLEVHLPFLQQTLEWFAIVPLVAGDATADEVAEVLDLLWGGPETLIVISSDLSHFHGYATARRLDADTASAIEAMAPDRIGDEQACGRVPIKGLLTAARRHGLVARTIDLRNSGDTAGPKHQVVGYGSFVFEPMHS